ncbi:hypothetical protein [Streptomyces venezuelae]|uniref:hypothetical protein n=1 Tax=Streptomyces venezuelae TaxID=54571 RepID=UPI001F44C981|nr:hypothetical protein [Streptomyces venezuelae]
MSSHAKRNFRPRPRVLGVVTGAALLLGGGFAVQAFADSGPRPAPKVAAPAPESAPAPKPVPAVKPVPAPAPAPAVKPVPAPAPAPVGGVPRVVRPGTGFGK